MGGGFGGVKTALELSKYSGLSVTLLSDHSHFRYYPTLFRTATGGKRAGARIRLNNILQGTAIRFIKGTATTLDRAKKEVHTAEGQKIPFDMLVLGLGTITNYFGIKGLPEYSYSIKSSDEAERFKKHLHEQFIANGCPDLNYIIVGGGPTGIELAGALPDYLRYIMKRHGAKDCKLHIKLVEAAPRLLPRSPKAVSRAVTKRLKELGIEIMLGSTVEGQTPDMLMAGGKPLMSHTVVWTAGVTNNPFFKANNFRLTDRGKVEVDDYLQAEQNIFVIGDNANTPFSGMAQTALYDGEFVARNIDRITNGAMPESYIPKQPISVIPVGPHWASVEWGKRTFSGWTGWMLRSFADLIGFHDLQSWPKAGQQWITSMESEEPDCCKKK